MTGHSSPGGPRLVVVHERFTEVGGSERVVDELLALSERARVFAPIADPRFAPSPDGGLTTSGLQRLYRSTGRYGHLLPLLPVAMANADLSDADVVVASHHAFANRVQVPDGVPLISYTHTPARWIWDRSKRRGERGGALGAAALGGFASAVRGGDRAAAQHVDVIVANSRNVARRIERWWDREATVIHPPVDVEFFTPGDQPRGDFFLTAGRLVPYKRAHAAIAAANQLGANLVVAGSGRCRPELERMAGPTVYFTGSITNEELRELYRTCRALVFPGEEDFGIVPVEAQACGAPVIAARVGGATETVVDGSTGVLVDVDRPSDPDSAADGAIEAFRRVLEGFDGAAYDTATIRANAETFSAAVFRGRFDELLSRTVPGWVPTSGPVDEALPRPLAARATS